MNHLRASVQLDLDEGTADLIQTNRTMLHGWYIYNAAASARFVKFYDKATAATAGTDTPSIVLAIPATSAANVFCEAGLHEFKLGLSVSATTGVANNDTGAPSANDVIATLFYR